MFWVKNSPSPDATMLFGCSPAAEITRWLTIVRSALDGSEGTGEAAATDVVVAMLAATVEGVGAGTTETDETDETGEAAVEVGADDTC